MKKTTVAKKTIKKITDKKTTPPKKTTAKKSDTTKNSATKTKPKKAANKPASAKKAATPKSTTDARAKAASKGKKTAKEVVNTKNEKVNTPKTGTAAEAKANNSSPEELSKSARKKAAATRKGDMPRVNPAPDHTPNPKKEAAKAADKPTKLDEHLGQFAKWIKRDIVDAQRQFSRQEIQDYIDRTAHKNRVKVIEHEDDKTLIRIEIEGDTMGYTIPGADEKGEVVYFKSI